jgi:hypothetical protein
MTITILIFIIPFMIIRLRNINSHCHKILSTKFLSFYYVIILDILRFNFL